MTDSISNAPPGKIEPRPSNRTATWYRPTFSHEHGVYVVLFVSLLTGAAAAQQWTLTTTLACLSAFAGFQAEHPLVLQIKQRRSLKPRFLVWGAIYSGIALGIAAYLSLQAPVLIWLYLGAIMAFAIDAISVFYRQQKSVVNELITFAAVCLATPFVYAATVGTLIPTIFGLWALNWLFFSSAIFTVKLRKPKTAALLPGVVYHAIASFIVAALCYFNFLSPFTAAAFIVVLLKFAFILARRNWYQTAPIQKVAILETFCALLFLFITAISLLPAHLSTSNFH
ncbi:YwiC-like family protein [Oscillatoria sp. FACHB-1406]|uniref:YwiC-like family protein n=1 Tax=Oscillatoria sp. FACHB-1406 TaxID=2692846 RepID=UPI001F554650|nr:YwiC-like family protein [Oscillatoria sp. FACHB-1406]